MKILGGSAQIIADELKISVRTARRLNANNYQTN